MIDTLALYTNDFAVIDENWFDRKDYYENGQLVRSSFYRNDDPVFVEFHRTFLEDGFVDSPLRIHFSLPKLLDGRWNVELDREKLPEASEKLLEAVSGGVLFNPESLEVGRVDIFKNIRGYEPNIFIRVLSSFTHSQRYKRKIYEDRVGVMNFTLWNKSKEVGVYDKRREMLEKYGHDIGEDIVRVELRVKKHAAAKRLGLGRFMDVLDFLSDERRLMDLYDREVGKIIKLNRSVLDKAGEYASLLEMDLREFKKWLLGRFMAEENYSVPMEMVERAYSEGKISKRTYYRHKRELEECYQFYKVTVEKLEKYHPVRIYEELFYKVA